MRKSMLVAIAALSITSACSGGDDGGGGPPDPPALTCDAVSTYRLVGVVGDTGTDLTTDLGGHSFSDSTGGGSLEMTITSGTGSELALAYLEWDGDLSPGGSRPAIAHVSILGDDFAGNCEPANRADSRIWQIETEDENDEEWRFELKKLHATPYCSGDLLDGLFTGCAYSDF